MKITKKIVNLEEAHEFLADLGREFAVVYNPDYVHPQYEIYPIAQKVATPLNSISAILVDLDGTTTSTEKLNLHSLETMVRRISGRYEETDWKGLDKLIDYPNIIGNSTTKHLEYIINRYNNFIKKELLLESYVYSVLWTLFSGREEDRKRHLKDNVRALGLGELLKDKLLFELENKDTITKEHYKIYTTKLVEKYKDFFKVDLFNDKVRVAVDIYHQIYHEILEQIEDSFFENVNANHPTRGLIEPMPGTEIFLALTKGWLIEEDAEYFVDLLIEAHKIKNRAATLLTEKTTLIENLKLLINYFNGNPVQLATVTSLDFYEAKIIITELFRVMQYNVTTWKISESKIQKLYENFASYKNIYGTFVTGTDSSELRLKPHRDLYSIALNKLNVFKHEFNNVIAFEDTESGTVAIRSAGIGLCVALPSDMTYEHNFEAATFVCKGGLPEVILYKNLFIKI